MKDTIVDSGLNLSQTKRDPFSFQYGYNYYEPKIYSNHTMDRYFEGFNLRQLKKMMFIYNQVALSYQSYIKLMDNIERRGETLSPLQDETLTQYISLYDKVQKIVNFMNKFTSTTRTGEKCHYGLFGEFYTKKMSGRCWVHDDERLRNQKHVRFIDEHGRRWQVGETEEYYPTDGRHISGINNISILFNWGYWLEYFKIGCSEDWLSTEELNSFDISIMDDLYVEALSLKNNLTLLNYLRN